MCVNFDVDVGWIASALHYTGFLTVIGLAMTVGRLRCYGIVHDSSTVIARTTTVEYGYSTSPKQSS
ncbi:MAG: hypothetical protein FWC76_02780 [Defluviitaleaceae bacterium]|nr:hypothetical protein [Defluviitaleaceae bacterium]